jgi:deoxyribose-phosphate aldolase
MIEDKLFETEKRELDVIIGRGVSFEVEQTTYRRKKGIFGRLKKREKFTEKVKYIINEPTLSTLDLISAEQIELRIDESMIASDTGINEAKKISAEQCKRMAKILAICVLGEDYVLPIQKGSAIKYVRDEKRLQELTEIFMAFVKPSKLVQLTLLVNTISNLGDFINSIRLMSASRTTMPVRIEGKQQA